MSFEVAQNILMAFLDVYIVRLSYSRDDLHMRESSRVINKEISKSFWYVFTEMEDYVVV